ncbi:hypothetical protein OsI_38526 [Oryza sativa Indica Group]|uniref:Uncharacterized protein n=1 Tax=Oryza sativa subsp. indica TaxID=39946 RepID=B8BM66_ORYSI|nr:hypothetical protein OsI_38526 [Oryza sativa Indica Group]
MEREVVVGCDGEDGAAWRGRRMPRRPFLAKLRRGPMQTLPIRGGAAAPAAMAAYGGGQDHLLFTQHRSSSS